MRTIVERCKIYQLTGPRVDFVYLSWPKRRVNDEPSGRHGRFDTRAKNRKATARTSACVLRIIAVARYIFVILCDMSNGIKHETKPAIIEFWEDEYHSGESGSLLSKYCGSPLEIERLYRIFALAFIFIGFSHRQTVREHLPLKRHVVRKSWHQSWSNIVRALSLNVGPRYYLIKMLMLRFLHFLYTSENSVWSLYCECVCGFSAWKRQVNVLRLEIY